MSKVVWRFVLNPDGGEPSNEEGRLGFSCDVEIPEGAQFLPGRLELTTKGPALYALVDPDAATETHSFFVCGNGVEVPDDGAHVLSWRGTYKETGGLTAHVFELVQAQVV